MGASKRHILFLLFRLNAEPEGVTVDSCETHKLHLQVHRLKEAPLWMQAERTPRCDMRSRDGSSERQPLRQPAVGSLRGGRPLPPPASVRRVSLLGAKT